MFDFEILSSLISPIIVVACLTLGYVIKHGFQNKTINAFIPLILATVGAVANLWYVGAIDLPTLVAGAVSGLAATGLYEGFTNILNLPKLSQEINDIQIEYGNPTDTGELTGKHFYR